MGVARPGLISIEGVSRPWSLGWKLGLFSASAVLFYAAEQIGLWTGHCVERCGYSYTVVCQSLWPAVPSFLLGVLGLSLVLNPTRLRLIEWAARRRLIRQPVLASVSTVPQGSVVRVQGRVAPGSEFTTAGGTPRAVLASYLTSRRSESWWARPSRELHAVDLRLELDSGEELIIALSLSRVRWLDELNEAWAAREGKRMTGLPETKDLDASRLLHDEASISEGERIEVLGTVFRDVDPGGDAGYRGHRLVTTIRSQRKRPLLLRRVPLGQ